MQLFVGTSVSANTRPAGHRKRTETAHSTKESVYCTEYCQTAPKYFFTGNYLVFQITWNNFWWNNRVDYYVMGSLMFLRPMLKPGLNGDFDAFRTWA